MRTELTPGATIDLELYRGAAAWWRIRLGEGEKASLARTGGVRVRRDAPWFLPAGAMTMVLAVNGYRVSGAEAQVSVVNRARADWPRAERRQYHGRTTFFVDGRPLVWSGYASYDYQPGNVGDFGASGANMFVVPVAAGRHVHQVSAPTWRDWNTYDFSELDERVAMGLQANPDSYITVRVSLALPPFWIQEHPESAVLIRGAQRDTAWEETGSLAVSLASAAWRTQQETCLRALLRHCKAQPWSKRVAAVILGGEVTEEWFMWGCNDGQYADYSVDSARAFNSWRKERGLAPAAIPSPAERNLSGYDVFPPSDSGKASASYAQYTSDKTAETIDAFAEAVKDETQGKCLVGVFYGYVVQLAGEPRQSLSGHFALQRIIDSPHVDYLLGIPLHNFRRYADGYDLYTSATESILAHGKGYANENDLFSWLHNGPWYTEYFPADPRAGAIRMHQRVLGDDLVHGVSRQWFSLLASWHHDAGLQREFAREIGLTAAASRYDRTPVEEIAFVVDDTSFAWMPPASSLSRVTNADFLYAMGRTGAPVGVWLLSDVDKLPARIRMVVVAIATAPRPTDLEKLRGLIVRGGRAIVVVGPAGLVNPERGEWNTTATSQLTGFPISVDTASQTGVAKTTANGVEVSHIATLRPRAAADAPGLMVYADGKTAGLERLLDGGGRLIWCGVPPLDSDLLRSWVERAGVHCYAPVGFTVHASRQLVSVTASRDGATSLHWPRSVAAQDLLTGWKAAGLEVLCPFETGQTRIFAFARP